MMIMFCTRMRSETEIFYLKIFKEREINFSLFFAKKDKSGLKNRKQLLFYPARLMKQ